MADSQTITFKINWRLVSLLLALGLVAMLLLWRPWSVHYGPNNRTITVTGQTTIKEAPDEFVFTPNYDFTNADKTAALAALTAKQAEVVTGIKKLGVADKSIKTDSSGSRDYNYDDTAKTYTYNFTPTVTVSSRDLAQKVQDYLVTTDPTGSVSPNAQFSDTLRKKLETAARGAATKDARTKAEQSAANLGFKLGAVKSVDDSGSGGIFMPMMSRGALSVAADAEQTKIAVQPGQNDLEYSVTVVYYVK